MLKVSDSFHRYLKGTQESQATDGLNLTLEEILIYACIAAAQNESIMDDTQDITLEIPGCSDRLMEKLTARPSR